MRNILKTLRCIFVLLLLLSSSCKSKIDDSEKEIMTLRLDDKLRNLYRENTIVFYDFNVECKDLYKVDNRNPTIYEGRFVVTFSNRENEDRINMHIIVGFDTEQFIIKTNSKKYDITHLVLLVNNEQKKSDSPYILPEFY